jgi:hypothetical protein
MFIFACIYRISNTKIYITYHGRNNSPLISNISLYIVRKHIYSGKILEHYAKAYVSVRISDIVVVAIISWVSRPTIVVSTPTIDTVRAVSGIIPKNNIYFFIYFLFFAFFIYLYKNYV